MLIFPSLLQKCKCIMFRMLALGMSYNIQCMYCFLFPKPENSWFMRHVWTQWFGMRDYGPVLEKCRMDAHIVLRITYHASEPEDRYFMPWNLEGESVKHQIDLCFIKKTEWRGGGSNYSWNPGSLASEVMLLNHQDFFYYY